MRAIAFMLSLSLAGCFPHNHHARTLAKYTEGGALVAGIALEAVVNSAADCDANRGPNMPGQDAGCRLQADILGDAGVALIVGGLLGFVATVSTEPDAEPPPPLPTVASDRPAPRGALKLPPGVKPGHAAAR